GGTTSVKADHGKMIAVKRSEFSLSIGDNPGVLGGVKSSTFMKESTWILYSFDVKMNGRNACRLTDKKFQNHQNTVDLAGVAQSNVIVQGINITQAACECIEDVPYSKVEKNPVDDWLKCCFLGSERHMCVAEKISAQGGAAKGVHSPAGANYGSGALPERKKYCRPDIVITAPGVKAPAHPRDMQRILDLKFQCADKKDLKTAAQWDPDKQMSSAQKKCYEKITGADGKGKPGGVRVDTVAPTKENCG
ncbi:MAG: DUF4150 domain-containing protein, partial [Burkholderiaceae bacterium]|nr:DUF4150 domain-containing protein [Burkholderiaceae bacterium]